MKRALRLVVLVAVALAEPVMHALGLPHPEGLSAQAANIMATWSD